jgi:hypothetical protein
MPTQAEAIDQALSEEEAQTFKSHLRPLVERGQGNQREVVSYLQAVK